MLPQGIRIRVITRRSSSYPDEVKKTQRHPRKVFSEVERVERAAAFVGRIYLFLALLTLDYIFLINKPYFSKVNLYYNLLTILVLISFFWINNFKIKILLLSMILLGICSILFVGISTNTGNPSPFIPITVIVFSGILLAVTNTPMPISLIFSAAYLILELLIIMNIPGWLVGKGSSVYNIPVAVFYHAVATFAGILAFRKLIALATLRDLANSEIENVQKLLTSNRIAREDRMRRLGQLHQSLLNLFVGLSGVRGEPSDLVISTAKAALDQLDESQKTPGDLAGIFNDIISKHQLDHFKVRLIPGRKVELSQQQLDAITVIMSELVNNAIRHSQGDMLKLGWQALDKSLLLFCEDNGTGKEEFEFTGLGWKEIIAPRLLELEAKSRVVKVIPQGLRVEIALDLTAKDLSSSHIEEVLRTRYTNLNQGLTWANGTAGVGLCFLVPILSINSSVKWELNFLAIFIAVYYFFLLTRRQLINRSTIFTGFFLSVSLLLLAKFGFNPDQDPAMFHWYGLIAGSGLLVCLTEFTGLATLIAVPTFFIVMIKVGLELPSYERKFISIPLVTAGILGCLTLVVAWFYRRTEAKGETFSNYFLDFRWKEEVTHGINERSHAKWNDLLQQSRDLLNQIISKKPIDDVFAANIALEESRVRAHLQIESLQQKALEDILYRLVENAYAIDRRITLLIGSSDSILHLDSDQELQTISQNIRPYFDSYESDLIVDVFASNPALISVTGKSRMNVSDSFQAHYFDYKVFGDGSTLLITVDTSVKELVQ